MSLSSPLLAQWKSCVARFPDRVAIEDDSESVTFAELDQRALGTAHRLTALGLASQRIGLLCDPTSRWVESFWAVLLAGGTVVPLSPLYPELELRELVESSSSTAIVTAQAYESKAREAAGENAVVLLEEPRSSGAAPTDRRAKDVALLLHTSGTTGKPKGVPLSDANVSAGVISLQNAWGITHEDVLLHVLPLHHLHGLAVALLTCLLRGAKTRFMQRFDARAAWQELGRTTMLMAVPTQHRKLFDAFDEAQPSEQAQWKKNCEKLRLVTSGSAGLAPALGERWRELTGGYPLERYGMTEIGIVLSNPLSGKRRPGSCGLPLQDVELRIVDEGYSDVSTDQSGELWVKAPTVFDGYDRNPEATHASFHDGWFKTGDTARWLEDGYVQLLGRTSVDILKSGGYKLSAIEIENVLREHSAIVDVAVVGVPDETWGDIVTAAAVAVTGRESELELDRFRAWAKERLAAYKVPKQIVLFEELPRNALGKVTKPELRSRVLQWLLASKRP